jgi:hypothetical protein
MPMMRQAHNDSLNSSIDSRRPNHLGSSKPPSQLQTQQLPPGSSHHRGIGSMNSSMDMKQSQSTTHSHFSSLPN